MGSQSTKKSSNSNWRGYSGYQSTDSVRNEVYKHYKNDLEKDIEEKQLNKENPIDKIKIDEIEENYKSKHKIKLSKVYYNYKAIGSHRFIELYLTCKYCSFSKYVRMDKTEDACKNMICFDNAFNEPGWWFWEYKPKRTDFEDCINYFNKGPTGYHLLLNNCADFARYIWNRLD